MLVEFSSATCNNFMLYAFLFTIICGYWAYRLISKILDHYTHTQCIDTYARHFSNNKHMISNFGATVSDFATKAENYFFMYYMSTYIGDYANSIAHHLVPTILNYVSGQNERSDICGVAAPVVKTCCDYFNRQNKSSKKSKKNTKKNANICAVKVETVAKTDDVFTVNNELINNLFQSTTLCGQNNYMNIAKMFATELKNKLGNNPFRNTTPDDRNNAMNILKMFTTDIRNELDNHPIVNKFVDSYLELIPMVLFSEPDDLYKNFIECVIKISCSIDESERKIFVDLIAKYIDDSTKTHLIKDFLTIFSGRDQNVDFGKFYELIPKLMSKYSNPQQELPPFPNIKPDNAIRVIRNLV